MNCPHCNQPVPENQSVNTPCGFCGRELQPAGEISPANLPPVKIKWIWFWLALMGPPLLTLLSAYLVRMVNPSGASNESLTPAIALLGGGAGGLACGIFMGVKGGKTLGMRVGLSFFLSLIMIFVCIMLSFFGCSAGGYEFNIH